MFITKNNILFLFVVSAFLALFNFGCTRKIPDSSTIQLSFGSGIGSSKITEFKYSEPMSMQSVSAQEEGEGAEWNASLNPSTLTDVNCYMIMVSGPEADMRRNTCTTTTGTNLKVGRWIGGIPSGSTISIEVPSGSQREITVLGLKASVGACTNFKNSDVNGSSLSEPHVIGKIVKDLTAGTNVVNIPITLSANALKLDDCGGPDFNMEQAPLYFGDATTGTTTVSTSDSYSSLGGVAFQLTSFENEPVAPNEASTYIQTSGTPTGININDEIMITNPAQDGTWTNISGQPQIGPCGYRMWEGRYAFARVKATDASGIYIHKGTFMDKLNWDPTSNQLSVGLKSIINSNLVASPTAGGTFCKLRITKVLHFWDLTLNAGADLNSDMFELNMASTGILPIRVANNLTMEDGSKISASGYGFMPSSTRHGTGTRGSSLVNCTGPFSTNTGSGGSCAPDNSSGFGAGGGGHGNLTANDPFGLSGGLGGGGPQVGGHGVGENCGDGSCFGTLTHKIFMGGSGGSAGNASAGTGGAGGGIIYIMAKNINLDLDATVTIENHGSAGNPNTTITNHGASGGGAGGSIFVGFGNLNAPGTSILYATAMGGGGGTATPTGASGGGGGGGGRIHLMSCNTSSTALTNTSKVFPMANGGSGGGASLGSVGGMGLAGSIVKAVVPCN